MPKPISPIGPRFWQKVNQDGPIPLHRPEIGPCWVWTAALGNWGYGVIGFGRRLVKAHRASWELHYGPIPVGLKVLHHCDNPPCVRPDHLFIGTLTDNSRDMVSKGRRFVPRGEQAALAKLTADQVRQIRAIYVPYVMGYQRVANRFGVAKSTIMIIIQGKTWRDVA